MNAPAPGRMEMGDIVAGAFNLYRRRFGSWLLIVLATTALSFALQWLFIANADLPAEATAEQLGNAAPWMGGLTVAVLLAALFEHIALVAGATTLLGGGALSPPAAYLTGLRRYLPALLGSLAVAALLLTLAVTLILIPLALFLLVRWSMIVQVIVAEQEPPFRALARSSRIVRGQWWRTLGINLAIILLGLLPGFALGRITAISDAAWLAAAGAAAGRALAAPFEAIAQTLLYSDLRARKGERPFVTPVQETV